MSSTTASGTRPGQHVGPLRVALTALAILFLLALVALPVWLLRQ